jgi:hypothetical protein
VRHFLFVVALALTAFAGSVDAHAEAPIVTDNPRTFANDLAGRMQQGVGALRETYAVLFAGAALAPQLDAALIVYERGAAGKSATVHAIADDVALSNVFRSIYLYHYYGENMWMFTRVDFARIADNQWAVTSLSFSSEWSQVVSTTTPGFRRP